QLLRDALLVFLDRRALPEVLAVVLHPKGAMRASDQLALESPLGWTGFQARWRAVELWTLPAEELLATNDPGVMPWVPLSHSTEPAPVLLRRCRDVIDSVPLEEERWNLLAVTQVLARLRYNDPKLLDILGGKRAMIESPLIDEWRTAWIARDIGRVLRA